MSKSSSPKRPSRSITGLTLAAFSLVGISPQARGSSASYSSVGSTGSSGTGTSSLLLTTSVFTVLPMTTTVGVIVLIVVIINNQNEKMREQQRQYQEQQKEDQKDEQADASRTRALMDSGLVTARGDLGLSLSLLARSPSAFDQLSDEVERGQGPALSELARATGLPPEALAGHHRATAGAVGPAVDQDSAERFVLDMLVRMAPSLELHEDQAAAFLWQLAQEQAVDPAAGTAHAWMERWMGVPLESVVEATAEALAPLSSDPAALRASLYADPDAALDTIALAIDARNRAEVDARIAELIQLALPWIPGELTGSALKIAG
jgi:hypothetical protein